MLVTTKSNSRQLFFALAISSLVCIFIVFSDLQSNSTDFLQQLEIASVVGILTFIILWGGGWIQQRISNRWLSRIGPLELFKLCNDTTEQVYAEVCNLLAAKEKNNDTGESLFLGGKSECFVYSFGLVLVSMLSLDPHFLQTNRYQELKKRILRRMVDIAKEKYSSISIDMGLVENQLRKTKEKELQNVTLAVEYYVEHSANKNVEPLMLLVKYLAERASLNGPKNFKVLTNSSYAILDSIYKQIKDYKNKGSK